jgi:hypothetical protein
MIDRVNVYRETIPMLTHMMPEGYLYPGYYPSDEFYYPGLELTGIRLVTCPRKLYLFIELSFGR